MGIIHKKGLKMYEATVCGGIKTREPLCLPFAVECVVGEILSLRGIHTHAVGHIVQEKLSERT